MSREDKMQIIAALLDNQASWIAANLCQDEEEVSLFIKKCRDSLEMMVAND